MWTITHTHVDSARARTRDTSENATRELATLKIRVSGAHTHLTPRIPRVCRKNLNYTFTHTLIRQEPRRSKHGRRVAPHRAITAINGKTRKRAHTSSPSLTETSHHHSIIKSVSDEVCFSATCTSPRVFRVYIYSYIVRPIILCAWSDLCTLTRNEPKKYEILCTSESN